MIGRFRFATALAGLFVPVAILTACGGKGVPIGSNADELRTVDPKTVAGSVLACAAEHQHANVCCKGGPNEESACVAYVNSPFHKCDDGWTTYPDPNKCCDLNNPASCAAPPPGPPPPVGCGYACAPGWWPVVNSPGECCHMLPGGNSLECSHYDWGYAGGPPMACASPVEVDAGPPIFDGGPVPESGPVDAGPAPDAQPIDGGHADGGRPPPLDGGVLDSGPYPPPPECDAGPPVPAPPPWPSPICNTPCPVGFHPLPADPSICCAPEPNGGEVCFSQAVGPVGPSTPGGQPPSGGVGGGSGSGGSTPPSPGK